MAGSVPKGDAEAKIFNDWRSKYKQLLQKFFEADFIEPYHKELDEGDFLAVVGQDCRHIKDSSLVIVNAEEILGVGTAQEIVIAKYFNKPVISILPKDTHHRRPNVVFHGKLVEDWIHPFIFTFSDFIVESIDEIEKIKGEIFSSKIKDISVIDEAIHYIDSK
ncbi:MAG: hypothetical protein P9M00_00785 [Candidatus Tritonobacter lacicola]|nr:hypothetical protein [Candidatus Tritonobacter lacicola]